MCYVAARDGDLIPRVSERWIERWPCDDDILLESSLLPSLLVPLLLRQDAESRLAESLDLVCDLSPDGQEEEGVEEGEGGAGEGRG